MSATTAGPANDAAVRGEAATPTVTVDRPGIGRWIGQPLVVVAAVVGCLVYVNTADVTDVERRSLTVDNLLDLTGQHLFISLVATLLTCVVAIPLGIALTRGPMRRFSKPIITVAGFGQAAPAIGLIALGSVIFDVGATGAIVALAVYGILPIVANTVTGLDGVDQRLVEASRGMGVSAGGTLVRVERRRDPGRGPGPVHRLAGASRRDRRRPEGSGLTCEVTCAASSSRPPSPWPAWGWPAAACSRRRERCSAPSPAPSSG
ncbi:ABC transporter permease subunit [Aeromicrobium sp. REDSEA-S32_B7]|uniref:ABC transporter permease n=1 Tax=Aeromicrobium sp. REDSEA-S32_B7 TaxID=1811526 RepID=UPI000A8D72FD|nr:ABC transporter permease subunit [Aeromicrobium sp. REDSEA-S32_B7]